jgi:putative phage-type endonuclease
MIKQNTPEWLVLRKNYIGASDSPKIMGVSPYGTAYDLWQEKLGLVADKETSWAMQRGHNLEEPARLAFEGMTGLLTAAEVKFHPKINYMMASIDGIDVEEKAIVEIKCPNKVDHAIATAGEVPEKYFPQLQHQLEVCELEMAYYFSFDGKTGVIVKVFRDDKYIQKLLQKEKDFWECVQEMKAPQMVEGKDYVKRTEEEWMTLAVRMKEINAELKKSEVLEKEKEDIKRKLIQMAGSQNAVGGGIILSQVVKQGTIDYKSIPELQNIDLEKYRKKPIMYWRLGEK